VERAIGFADLVGFTAASELLSPLEVGEMASRLLTRAEEVLPEHGAHLVKTIGDSVMFDARTAPAACAAALALVDAIAATPGMPPLRVGLAHGPVLRRLGDYFGRTVNVASRLCAAGAAGEVLLLATAAEAADPGEWERLGVQLGPRRQLELRGITGTVEALVVERRRD
jgi:adenylate cyclase